jgi:exosortase A
VSNKNIRSYAYAEKEANSKSELKRLPRSTLQANNFRVIKLVNESAVKSDQPDTTLASAWKLAALTASIPVLGIILFFLDTIRSMITAWSSEPYTYGATIFPICLWLIWTKRGELARLTPRPEFRAVILTLLAGALWLQASLINFQFLQQIALICLLITTVWSILGTRITKTLAFPLTLLLFAAPPLFAIEPLYPVMQEFTTDYVVRLLQWTGIAVYREGYYIQVSNGNWAVDEQCSGLQYLTSSVIVGCVYAYYCYRSTLRRLLILILAISIPIIANVFRAYIIVIIGYLSDMKLAVGLDHIVYGWIFYFIVIYAMFVIGSYWWEQSVPAEPEQSNASSKPSSQRSMQFVGAGVACLLAASVWPGIAVLLNQSEPPGDRSEITAPAGVDGWKNAINRYWLWSPQIHRSDGEVSAFYHRGGKAVSLHIARFLGSRKEADPFGRPNVMIVPEARSWRNDIRNPKEVAVKGGPGKVLHAKTVTIFNGNRWGDLLVWYWYRVGDRFVTSPFQAKLLDSRLLLTGGEREISLIAMATTFDGDTELSESVLRSFAGSMMTEINSVLERSADE